MVVATGGTEEAPVQEAFVKRKLYGGAIELHLPERMQDVSNVRPVPDHQEVYTDAATDQSIMVEILERSDVQDDDAARYYLQDQATNMGVQSIQLLDYGSFGAEMVLGAPSQHYKAYAIGTVLASKGRQGDDAANNVMVAVAVIRLKEVASDLTITLNTPVFVNTQSAAAEHTGAGPTGLEAGASKLFESIVSSLAIKDWGLFGS